MPDWYGDKFDSNPDGDLQELVESVEEGRRYGVPGRTAYTRALGQQQLGQGARFDANSNGQRSELVRLQMPQEFARDWTVHWSVSREQLENPAGPGFLGNARAQVGRSFLELRWGSGGAQHFAEVDVRFGGSVTLHGSYVEVVAVGAGIGATAVGGVIAATIAPGSSVGGRNELTRTVLLGTVADVSTMISLVPPRAIRFALITGSQNPFVECFISFDGLVAPPAGLGTYRIFATASRSYIVYGQSVLVPPAAVSCSVNVPLAGPDLIEASLIYTLDL